MSYPPSNYHTWNNAPPYGRGPQGRGMGGLRGLGAFNENEVVPEGTRVRVQCNATDLAGVRLFFVLDNQLDLLSAELRKGLYRVLKRTSSYSQITYELELGHAKVSMAGVLADFSNSMYVVGIGTASNLTYDVLYDPRTGGAPPATHNTAEIPDNEDTNPDKKKKPDYTLYAVLGVLLVTTFMRR
jgi:hypothetical protein